MNDLDFFNSFHFMRITHHRYHHNDASAGVGCHYFGFMERGMGRIVAADERIEIAPGELFYIPKGCKYHSYWSGDDVVKHYSIGFDYLPREGRASYRLQKLEITPEVDAALQALLSDFTVSAAGIGRLYTLVGALQPSMKVNASDRLSLMAEKAVHYMDSHPNDQNRQVAEACGISEATLYLTFRKSLNKTPNAVRQEILCEKAAQLLATTDHTVEEISRRLGFSSSSYFRKVFTGITGKTPREYRKKSSL